MSFYLSFISSFISLTLGFSYRAALIPRLLIISESGAHGISALIRPSLYPSFSLFIPLISSLLKFSTVKMRTCRGSTSTLVLSPTKADSQYGSVLGNDTCVQASRCDVSEKRQGHVWSNLLLFSSLLGTALMCPQHPLNYGSCLKCQAIPDII